MEKKTLLEPAPLKEWAALMHSIENYCYKLAQTCLKFLNGIIEAKNSDSVPIIFCEIFQLALTSGVNI